jgi:hypothetical protein
VGIQGLNEPYLTFHRLPHFYTLSYYTLTFNQHFPINSFYSQNVWCVHFVFAIRWFLVYSQSCTIIITILLQNVFISSNSHSLFLLLPPLDNH